MAIHLHGTLVNPLGSPAANAMLKFDALQASATGGKEVIPGASQQTRCGADGSYDIELQAGTYRFSSMIGTVDFVTHGDFYIEDGSSISTVEQIINLISATSDLLSQLFVEYNKFTKDMNAAYDDLVSKIGWVDAGEWSTNPTATKSNEYFSYAGTNQRFRPLSLPYDVDSSAHPDPNALLPDQATGYAGELVDVSEYISTYQIADFSAMKFENVASMKAHSMMILKEGDYISTMGNSSVGDGGHGNYVVVSGVTPDGYVNHDIGGGLTAKLVTNNIVSSKQCGAFSNSDNEQIKAMFDELPNDLYILPEIDFEAIVGNDASTSFYHFDQLDTAIKKLARVSYAVDGGDKVTIKVPNGTHDFTRVFLNNLDASNVNLKFESEAGTILNVTPDRTSWGVWFTLFYSSIGEVSSFTAVPSSNVTKPPTDFATVCQEWTGEGIPPWPADSYFNFFKLQGGILNRIYSVTLSGNTGSGSSDGCLLGNAFQCFGVGTKIQIDNVEVKDIRQALNAYDGADVNVSYGGLSCTNVYVGPVVHNADMYIRKINFRGCFNGSTYFPNSQAWNFDRGDVSVFEGNISYVDYVFSGNAGRTFDGTTHDNQVGRSFKPSITNGSVITTRQDVLTTEETLSNNSIINNTTNGVKRKYIEYTGDGVAGRVVASIPIIQGAKIRRGDATKFVDVIKGQTAKISGSNAAFISGSDSGLRVYGEMNLSGVSYIAELYS